MDLERGMFVSDYELLEKAGAGGFSVVWKAKRPEDSALYAIKVPLVETFVEHLRREADLAGRFRHPRVVEILKVELAADPPHIVMPWVEGKPLELPTSAPPPEKMVTALETVLDLSRVLAALHEAGVLHGDVKPGNVLVDAEGHCHLLDLGLARVQMKTKLGRSLAQSLASVDGKPIAGTLEFMAPEIFEGREPGLAADVYSLGVLLHHALTGRPPAFGVSPQALNPYLPPGFEELLRRMLHHDPAAREANASGVIPDLERMIQLERRCLARRNGHERRRVFLSRVATFKRGARALVVAVLLPVAIAVFVTAASKVRGSDDVLGLLAALTLSWMPFVCLLLAITTINAWILGIPEKTYKNRKGHPLWSFMMQ